MSSYLSSSSFIFFISKLVLQKYLEVLNSSDCSISKVLIASFGVGVKSRAICPASQPVAISAIFAAGRRLSIFSEIDVETFWSLIDTDLLVCLTLPNTSFWAHSSVSLFLAAPIKILPQVARIVCIPFLP